MSSSVPGAMVFICGNETAGVTGTAANTERKSSMSGAKASREKRRESARPHLNNRERMQIREKLRTANSSLSKAHLTP